MKNFSQTFWAPMEGAALGGTLTVAVICMGLPVVFYKILPPTAWGTAVCVLPIVLFLGLSLFAVKSYQLDDGVLYIKRTLWNTSIALRPLESVEIKPDVLSNSKKIRGIGGVFGWIGSFHSESLGDYQAWVTDRQKTVVFKSAGKTYVVSPLDPWKFMKALEPLKT